MIDKIVVVISIATIVWYGFWFYYHSSECTFIDGGRVWYFFLFKHEYNPECGSVLEVT